MRYILLLLMALALPAGAAAAGGHDLLRGTPILLMRHANAPGIGDPPDFRLDQCETQRNLDQDGRAQAVAAGQWLRTSGIGIATVHSSRWCRALETASLLSLGPVVPIAAFDSFFAVQSEAGDRVDAMGTWLAAQPMDRPLLIVTHQVNITALSGLFPRAGEIVVLERSPDGGLVVRGRVQPR